MEEMIVPKPIELTEAELDAVSAGDQPNQNAGGGPGNSGPGDKNSPVEGPPHFP
jgi:hypothetical protein